MNPAVKKTNNFSDEEKDEYYLLVNSKGRFYQELIKGGVQTTNDPEAAPLFRSHERANRFLSEHKGKGTSDRLADFSVCQVLSTTTRTFWINIF